MNLRPNHQRQQSPRTSPLSSIELIKLRGLIDPGKEIEKRQLKNYEHFYQPKTTLVTAETVKQSYNQEKSPFAKNLVKEPADRGSQKKIEGEHEKKQKVETDKKEDILTLTKSMKNISFKDPYKMEEKLKQRLPICLKQKIMKVAKQLELESLSKKDFVLMSQEETFDEFLMEIQKTVKSMQKTILKQQIIMKERKNYISHEFLENYQLKEQLFQMQQAGSEVGHNVQIQHEKFGHQIQKIRKLQKSQQQRRYPFEKKTEKHSANSSRVLNEFFEKNKDQQISSITSIQDFMPVLSENEEETDQKDCLITMKKSDIILYITEFKKEFRKDEAMKTKIYLQNFVKQWKKMANDLRECYEKEISQKDRLLSSYGDGVKYK